MVNLFGIPMAVLMFILTSIFVLALLVVIGMAVGNRVMFKMGLRPIPRRPGMTALIIIGVMLSTIIMAAALGTADTLTFSIRNIAISGLQNIDEVIVPARAGEGDSFGRSYISIERYEELRESLAGDDRIDGLMPLLGEPVPTFNPQENLSEGLTQVVGIDPGRLEGFGGLTLTSGGEARIEDLATDEVYVNERAVKKLELSAGDDVQIFLEDETITLKVKGIIEDGGFAGIQTTFILPLNRAQGIFGKQGQINSIQVSNRGDELSGNDLSEDVTKDLRVQFSDQQIVSELQQLLNKADFLAALEIKRDGTRGSGDKEELDKFLNALKKSDVSDELVSALADSTITEAVFDILDQDDMRDLQREAVTLFSEIAEFRVLDIKHDLLRAGDQAGEGVTSFFLIFSLFSIASGILLIFLIFVLLAGARKSEMGMARAVGAKRRHLVQMFVFEGTAYALVSAAIGVGLGLLISILMVHVLNSVFATFEDDFTLKLHFTIPTIIVSYCLGMIITFATVAVSAYRVSYLNIVAAVRNLPEPISPADPPRIPYHLVNLLKGIFRPLIFIWRALDYIIRVRFVNKPGAKGLNRLYRFSIQIGFPFGLLPAVLNVIFVLVWLSIVVWIIDILIQLFKFLWPYLLQGWLLLVLGAAIVGVIAMLDIEWLQRWSYFGGGVTLLLAGLGLLVRTILKRSSIEEAVRDRIVFTAMGIMILIFWALPGGTFETLVGNLQGDFDVIFVSGIAMVGAAVWTVMYNADLLLGLLHVLTGRVRQLRPVMVTAVAYPLSAKFRTGLTLAMFALVIFTLIIMSVLTETFGTQFAETRVITGGWDVEGRINIRTLIDDIRGEIEDTETLQISQFESIGGYTNMGLQIREVEAESQRWHGVDFLAGTDEYLDASDYQMKLIADGFGSTREEVFQAIQRDPTLVVVGGGLLHDRQDDEGRPVDRTFNEVDYGDESMSPIEIEARDAITRTIVQLKVIGIVDRIHDTGSQILGIIGSKSAIENEVPYPIPTTLYRFRLVDESTAKDVAQDLERAFLINGMDTTSLAERLREETAALKSFFRLFTSFMALGLFVGIAALGVVSTRAVVERRQQIGMLRAIGYRRGMIQLSFLFESSFVALLGTIIGTILGLILSYNAVLDIRSEQSTDSIRFTVPWVQTAIILGLTYFFSLLATYIPARQASKIYPAEALRYE